MHTNFEEVITNDSMNRDTININTNTQIKKKKNKKNNNTFRVYVKASYHQKDIVKKLGAKWNTDKKLWYFNDALTSEIQEVLTSANILVVDSP